MSLIILSIVIVLFEFKRKKIYKYYDFLTLINAYYLIYFTIIPTLFVKMDLREHLPVWGLSPNILSFYNGDNNFLFANVMIIASYIIVTYMYYILKNKRSIKNTYNTEVSLNSIFIFGVISFFLGLFSLVYHTYDLGGVTNALTLAETYRSISSDLDSELLLLRIFQPFILSSFYCFLILNSGRKNFYIKLLLSISFLFSVYYLLLSVSRAKILIFLFTIILFRAKKINIKKLFFLLVLTFIGFVYGDQLLDFLQKGSITFKSNEPNDSIIEVISKVIQQTIFPYVNILKISNFVTSFEDWRYFSDTLYVWIINLIPTGILNIIGLDKITPLWRINTDNFHSITGGVPVDLLSYGYYQLGTIGVLINSMFFGSIVGYLEKFFILNNSNAMKLIKLQLLFIIPSVLINAELEVLIRGNLSTILMFLVFYFNKRKTMKSALLNEEFKTI